MGGGTSCALSSIQFREPYFGSTHNGCDAFGKPILILQTNQAAIFEYRKIRREQTSRLQFFTTETHDQRQPAQIRVGGDVFQRANRNGCAGRVDGNATAVSVRDGN